MPEDAAAKLFRGGVPDAYERLMVPLMFQPYADDMVARAVARKPSAVLELAAGTGAVTRELAAALPADSTLVATDLNAGMLAVAEARGAPRPAGAPAVVWQPADAQDLPFDDETFDLVVCQFGVMFFPDRPAAHAQVRQERQEARPRRSQRSLRCHRRARVRASPVHRGRNEPALADRHHRAQDRRVCPGDDSGGTCTDARARYRAQLARAAGIAPCVEPVDAQAAAVKVRALRALGLSIRRIAALTDCGRTTIGDLAGDGKPARTRVTPETLERILHLDVTAVLRFDCPPSILPGAPDGLS